MVWMTFVLEARTMCSLNRDLSSRAETQAGLCRGVVPLKVHPHGDFAQVGQGRPKVPPGLLDHFHRVVQWNCRPDSVLFGFPKRGHWKSDRSEIDSVPFPKVARPFVLRDSTIHSAKVEDSQLLNELRNGCLSVVWLT